MVNAYSGKKFKSIRLHLQILVEKEGKLKPKISRELK